MWRQDLPETSFDISWRARLPAFPLATPLSLAHQRRLPSRPPPCRHAASDPSRLAAFLLTSSTDSFPIASIAPGPMRRSVYYLYDLFFVLSDSLLLLLLYTHTSTPLAFAPTQQRTIDPPASTHNSATKPLPTQPCTRTALPSSRPLFSVSFGTSNPPSIHADWSAGVSAAQQKPDCNACQHEAQLGPKELLDCQVNCHGLAGKSSSCRLGLFASC